MGDVDTPQVFTRSQARAAGLTDRQIDYRIGKGQLTNLARGVLQKPSSAERTMRIPPELGAALLAHPRRDLVLSHLSAARVLGLPKPLGGWKAPELTASSGPPRRRSGTHIRVAPPDAGSVIMVDGVPITSGARTVLDCLRTTPARDGLAILDAALHRLLVTPAQLVETMLTQLGWPGIAHARHVLILGDGRRETPLESWAAWGLHSIGVPPLDWQVTIRSETGRFIGRTDCWWFGVAGEADGRSKYALAAAERGNKPGSVFDVLQAERRREQDLRDAGADVVRWSAADVLSEQRLATLGQRIQRALTQAMDAGKFTGTATPVVHPFATLTRPI